VTEIHLGGGRVGGAGVLAADYDPIPPLAVDHSWVVQKLVNINAGLKVITAYVLCSSRETSPKSFKLG